MRSRRNSVRHAVTGSGLLPGVRSPRAYRACVQGLLPLDPTVVGQQKGLPLRGKSCGIHYLRTIRIAMTLWHAFSKAAGRLCSDGAYTGAP